MAHADVAAQHYSLRFLSGKNQGSEFVLVDPSEVVVGRSQEVDVAMVEGMVSRRHARFRVKDNIFTLEDLGSTNGTFVNGERIKHRALSTGDRVLIGTTIMRVELSNSPVGTKPPPLATNDPIVESETTSRDVMSGELDQMGVPELIEMFATARQQLILEVDTQTDLAQVYIDDGLVLDCHSRRLGDGAPAEKVIFRIFSYQKGKFSLRPFAEPAQRRLNRRIPELLVDGLFKLDELEVLRQKLPDPGSKIVAARPLKTPLRSLADADLDLFQLAHNVGEVEAIIDEAPQDDLEVARRLLTLMDGGFLRKG